MWRSDRWKDYELIDCSRGEKLERWGAQLRVAPRPPGHLEYPPHPPGLEAQRGAVRPLLQRRGTVAE